MPPHGHPSNGENPTGQRPEPPHSNHQQHHHPYYSSASSSSASFKGCCCCLFLLFSFLALLILAVFLVIILAVKPKKPQFDLQQVGVQYMGITASNPTASMDPTTATTTTTTPATASLSLTIHMLFTAVNPNKVGIKYGESSFTVMYRGIPLGKALVPGFYQEAHSQRQVEATISVDRYSLMQADASDLIRDASLNDRVELRVLGEVGAKIRVLDLDSPGVQDSLGVDVVAARSHDPVAINCCEKANTEYPLNFARLFINVAQHCSWPINCLVLCYAMDFSPLTDAFSSKSYEKIADICDELMLKATAELEEAPFEEEWPFAIHLLSHI